MPNLDNEHFDQPNTIIPITPKEFSRINRPMIIINENKMEREEKLMNNYIKFILNGCDISFIAEAPKDITLEQLLKQCDRIKPDWCACGICSYDKVYKTDWPAEIHIDYDNVYKTEDDVSCSIKENK